MGLGREVHDRLDPVLGERRLDQGLVTDVALDEGHPPRGLELGDAAAVAGIGQSVEHDELVLRAVGRPVTHEVRTDEPGTAGYEKSHDRPRLIGPRPARPNRRGRARAAL